MDWYLPLITGLIFMAAGIYLFTVPLATYLTLTILFSISFISLGVAEIVFSIQYHKSLYPGVSIESRNKKAPVDTGAVSPKLTAYEKNLLLAYYCNTKLLQGLLRST